MLVKINEIQQIVNLILSKFKDRLGNDIEIDNDFYWDIPSDELYNPYIEPKNIGLGQLSSDLEEVKRFITHDDPIPYDLKRVATILIALSEKSGSF